MFVNRYLQKNKIYRPMVGLLCLLLVMPGCSGCNSEAVVEPPPETKVASYRQRLKDREKKLEQRTAGISEPENLSEAASLAEDIDSYASFKSKFENETGRDWDSFLSMYENNRRVYESKTLNLPDSTTIATSIKDTLNSSNVSSNADRESLKKVQNALNEFNETATEANTAIQEVKEAANGTFATVDKVVQNVKSLDGKSGAAAKGILQSLSTSDLPAMVSAVESLNDDKFEDLINGAKDKFSKVKSAQKELDKVRDVVGELKDKGVIDENINEFINKTDSTVEDMSKVFNSMAAMAMMASELAPIIAANPWVALAVFAIMAIMAIFSDGGGGDGDGEGQGSGEGDRSGEPSDPGPGPGETSTDDFKGDAQKGETISTGEGSSNINSLSDVTDVGSIGSNDDGNIPYEAGWRGDELVFRLFFNGTNQSGTDVVIKQHKDSWKPFMDQLKRAKNGQQTINVESVAAEGDPYPVTMVLTGFQDGKATFKWKSDGSATVNEIE